MSGRNSGERKPFRVFLSHTSNLRHPDHDISVVHAAERAVNRAGDVVVDMAYFAAGPVSPKEFCAAKVASSDVYICLAGIAFGSAVPGEPDLSFTEWEFDVATRTEMPRIGIIIDGEGTEPDARQLAFRARLGRSGITTARVSHPAELELAVFHALTELHERRAKTTRYRVPALPKFVVERPETAELTDALLGSSPGVVGATTSVQGAGGFGKTFLALEVCHRADVRQRFADGIVWVTLGENVIHAELAAKIDDLCEHLSGSRPGLSDPEQAGFRLAELLDERPELLFVIDDVWTSDQLRPFLSGGARCRRLVTTRNQRLFGADAITVLVDALPEAQASVVLLRDVGEVPEDVTRSLLTVTGRWPVLLALVNGAIRRFVRKGETVETAARRTLSRLMSLGPQGLDLRTVAGRHETVRSTIEASLRLLDDADRDRYHRLSVFAEDASITSTDLGLVWGAGDWGTKTLSPLEIEAYCDELADLSLVLREPSGRGIKLHDVIRSYLRSLVGDPGLVDMNRYLIRAASACIGFDADSGNGRPSAWWQLPAEHAYLWRYLVFHMTEGGLAEDCEQLVTDPRWIAAKAMILGPVSVDVDLAYSHSETGARLRAEVAQNAHLLSPIEPESAMLSVVVSRLDGGAAGRPDIEAELAGIPHLANAWDLPDRPDPSLRRILLGHRDAVWSVAIAPDGRWLVSGSTDGTARIWDARNGATRQVLAGHAGRVNCCVVAPDGTWIATASDDATVRIWDPSTGACLRVLEGHSDWVWSCSVSGDGRYLVSVGDDRDVLVWSCGHWALDGTLLGHTAGINSCASDRNGRLVATGSDDLTVRIWDLVGGAELRTLHGHDDWVKSCSLSRDGSVLATAGGADLSVRVWDTSSWQVRTIYLEHTAAVRACAVTPDGGQVASTGSDAVVRVWDTTTGVTLDVLVGHSAVVRACAVAPDGTWLASAGDDSTVRLWSLPAARRVTASRIRSSPVWSCTTAGGSTVVSGDEDGWIRIWDNRNHVVPVREFTSHGGPVRGLAAAPDGRRIAAATDDGNVGVWDATSGELLTLLAAHDEWVKDCRFSRDGYYLVTCGGDNALRFWESVSGRLVHSADEHPAWLWDCDVSRSGSRVAAACDDGSAYVYETSDVSALSAPLVLTGHVGPVRACAFTSDGHRLVTGGDDGIVRIRDAVTGATVRDWTGHASTIWSIATTPAHDLIATAGEDNVLRLWRPDVADEPVTAMRVDGPLRCSHWDEDGQTLTAGGSAGLYRFSLRGARFSEVR